MSNYVRPTDQCTNFTSIHINFRQGKVKSYTKAQTLVIQMLLKYGVFTRTIKPRFFMTRQQYVLGISITSYMFLWLLIIQIVAEENTTNPLNCFASLNFYSVFNHLYWQQNITDSHTITCWLITDKNYFKSKGIQVEFNMGKLLGWCTNLIIYFRQIYENIIAMKVSVVS